MPKVGTKTKTKVEEVVEEPKETQPEEVTTEMTYPEEEAFLCKGEGNPEKGIKPALTAHKMMELLGWETEDEYKERMKKEGDAKAAAQGFGDEFLLKDLFGRKVICHNNTKNRPFTLSWANALKQDILSSGPGLPKEKRRWKLNGENIVIGQYAQVLSGQHRGIGFVLAYQEWLRNKDFWSEIWPTEPTLDTAIFFGVEESQDVLRTIDNVKPRSLGDVFYTSGLFDDADQAGKKELARMLATAVGFLWQRTGLTYDKSSPDTRIATHGESCDFFDRHKQHLLEAINVVYKLNTTDGRKVSAKNLSPGMLAGALYLMGCNGSDPDEYLKHRSEAALDWQYWEPAVAFVHNLIAASVATPNEMLPVVEALGWLDSPEDGAAGRTSEKAAVLARAWNLLVSDQELTKETIDLDGMYVVKDGVRKLSLDEKFGVDGYGIDCGYGIKEPEPEPTAEELEEARKQAEAERLAKLEAKAKGKGKDKPTGEKPVDELYQELRTANPGVILFFKLTGEKKGWRCLNSDAKKVAEYLKEKTGIFGGMTAIEFSVEKYGDVVKYLRSCGDKVGIVEKGKEVALVDGGRPISKKEVVPTTTKSTPQPAPKAAANGKGKPQPTKLRGGTSK